VVVRIFSADFTLSTKLFVVVVVVVDNLGALERGILPVSPFFSIYNNVVCV
jgi:hypothetical protein